MSLGIAIQSAVWYYLSCTPCNRLQQDHRRRSEAKRARQERERRIVTEQPAAYRHPEACHTNPFWAEEIRAGPNPPPKRGVRPTNGGLDRRPDSSGGLNSSERLDSSGGESARSHRVSSMGSGVLPEASDGLMPPWTVPGVSGDCHGQPSNNQQSPIKKVVDALYKAGSSAGRFVEETLGIDQVAKEDRYDAYGPRNPPVNDLHPPVVSAKLPHPDLHKWMTEPPPPARIMEGRVPMRQSFIARKSLSPTTTTRDSMSTPTPTTDDPPPYDRILVEKRLEESARMARGPSEEELINSLIGQQDKDVLVQRRRSFSGGERELGLVDLGVPRGRRKRRVSSPPRPLEEAVRVARRVNSERVGKKTTEKTTTTEKVSEKMTMSEKMTTEKGRVVKSLTSVLSTSPRPMQRPKLAPILSSRFNIHSQEGEKLPATPSESEGEDVRVVVGIVVS